MKGYKLTIEQKKEIEGQCFTTDQYFNPTEDVNGDYFIFQKEVQECDNPNFMWVKELTLSDYVANPNNFIH